MQRQKFFISISLSLYVEAKKLCKKSTITKVKEIKTVGKKTLIIKKIQERRTQLGMASKKIYKKKKKENRKDRSEISQ